MDNATKNLIQLLTILEDASTYLFPESDLYTHFFLSVHPRPTEADFQKCLREAERKGYAIGVTGTGIDTRRKWELTDQGLSALARAKK